MLSGKRYKLTKATMAIERVDGDFAPKLIPKGETVRVLSGPTPTDSRLVELNWKGRVLLMFLEDLQKGAEETSGTQI